MNDQQAQSNPGQAPSSENLASIQTKYTDRSPLVRFANRRFHATISSLVSKVPFDSALDAGCGEGVVLAELNAGSTAPFMGMDLDGQRLREARNRLGAYPLLQGDLHNLPLETGSFDLVLCLEVLEHVGDPITAVAELQRVTRRYLLASVPNEPWWRIGNMLRLKYLKDWGNTPEHINHWSVTGFIDLLGPRFEVLEIRTPVLWTFVLAEKK